MPLSLEDSSSICGLWLTAAHQHRWQFTSWVKKQGAVLNCCRSARNYEHPLHPPCQVSFAPICLAFVHVDEFTDIQIVSPRAHLAESAKLEL